MQGRLLATGKRAKTVSRIIMSTIDMRPCPGSGEERLSGGDQLTCQPCGGAAAPKHKGRARAVVVAGMHRSGTSAVTRVLSLLGLDLPNILYPPADDNPLGYWEPQSVVDAHDRFLAAIGSSYDDVLGLSPSALSSDAAQALEDELVEILTREFGDSRAFVVKDPRICRVVPIWISVLERFRADASFVLPIRNPLEVAASLKMRNEFGLTKSLLLWLRHVPEAELGTRGHPRSVVAYEDMLEDWQAVVARISTDVSLSWPQASHAATAAIEAYLSPRQRHHAFRPEVLSARSDVGEWVKTAYGALSTAARGGSLDLEALDLVRAEVDRADLSYGPLIADGRARLATEQNYRRGLDRPARGCSRDSCRERR